MKRVLLRAPANTEAAVKDAPDSHRERPWQLRGSFVDELGQLRLDELEHLTIEATRVDVERALSGELPGLAEVAALISPAAGPRIEELALRAQEATCKRFGRAIQLFAPLYLSNHCVNTCLYCGFSRQNEIARKTLSVDEVEAEAELLAERGFRHLLLVSAEHPKLVSPQYLAECIEAAGRHAAAIQIEVQAQDRDTYRLLKRAGCSGVVIYQETYDRGAYARLHVHGLKRDMDNRLDAPDRIALAGIKKLGLGVLLGLSKRWRRDLLALVAHARYMQRRHWRTQLTVALPRLRPAAGGFEGPTTVGDGDFLQAICVLRLALPETGIVLSTREDAQLRNALAGVGVTQMSAGSSTEPGGYSRGGEAQEQFSIDDRRPADEVARMIGSLGYEPVWKDWENCI